MPSEAEKQRQVDDFFEQVSRDNPSEVIRLLDFFSTEWWAKQQATQIDIRRQRTKDPYVTPPNGRSLGAAVGK